MYTEESRQMPSKKSIGGRPHVFKCETCRKRKVKCGAERPACHRCMIAGLHCGGYQKKYEFIKSETYESLQSFTSLYEDCLDPVLRQRSHPDSDLEEQVLRWQCGPKRLRLNVETQKSRSTPLLILPPTVNRSLSVPQFRVRFLDILQDMCVPIIKGDLYCGTFVTEGCGEAACQVKGPLGDALLALSLRKLGRAQYTKHLDQPAFHLYARALQDLRALLSSQSLTDPEKEELFLVARVCAVFEMTTNSSFRGIIDHFSGIGKMFEAFGMDSLGTETLKVRLYEYRATDGLKLVERRANPLFTNGESPIHPVWRQNFPPAYNVLQSLIDIQCTLPSLLERYDILDPADLSTAQALYEASQTMSDDFATWEAAVPIPHDHPVRLQNKSHPSLASISFPEYGIAQGFMVLDMSLVFLLALQIDLLRILYKTETYGIRRLRADLVDSAWMAVHRLCRYHDYYFHEDKRMFGRMTFFMHFQTALVGLPEVEETGQHMSDKQLVARECCRRTILTLEAEGFRPYDEAMTNWNILSGTDIGDREEDRAIALHPGANGMTIDCIGDRLFTKTIEDLAHLHIA